MFCRDHYTDDFAKPDMKGHFHIRRDEISEEDLQDFGRRVCAKCHGKLTIHLLSTKVIRERFKHLFTKVREEFMSSDYTTPEMKIKVSNYDLEIKTFDHRLTAAFCDTEQLKIVVHSDVVDSNLRESSALGILRHEFSHACLSFEEGHGQEWTKLNNHMGGSPQYVTDPRILRVLLETDRKKSKKC